MSVFSELQRRGVVRVVMAYLAAAWLLLQIADLVFEAYGLSESAMATLVTVVAVGVVPAAVLAWVFEWTPEGIARDSGTTASPERARLVDRGIIVLLLLAVSYFAVDKFWLRPAVELEIDRSIAVLPFVNMSSDPEQDYFSDGISEELLNLLAKVRELRVISRSSSFAYRGQDINIPEVADALNVGYVLEGSVRKAGNRIRITAQLIEARTDKHLWSETYDRDLVDVFAIQDEVSAQIIDQLKIELTGEAPHAYRTDPETYALFLRAKARLTEIGLLGDPEAVRIMEDVVARDPDYVPALMYLATIISYESRNNGDEAVYPGVQAVQKIRELVGRSLQIDPSNAHAIAFSAYGVFQESRDVPRAVRMLERAVEYGASDGFVLRTAMAFTLYLGDFESRLRLAEWAFERDPSCIHCMGDYREELIRAGRLDEAEAVARSRMAMAPGGEHGLGEVYIARGDFDKALQVFGDIPYEGERLVAQAKARFLAGDLEGFGRLREEYAAKYGQPWQMAILSAIEGDADSAMEFLNVQFADSMNMFGFALRDPVFEILHNRPGWKKLRERAGLSEANIQGIKFNLPDGI